MNRMVTQTDRTVIPTVRMQEFRNTRRRRSDDYGERALEAYFAVLTIVILGMIVGLGAYAALYVIPGWQRSNSLRDQQNHLNPEFRSYPSERR